MDQEYYHCGVCRKCGCMHNLCACDEDSSFSRFIRGEPPYTKEEKRKLMMEVINAACERQAALLKKSRVKP